MQIHRWQCRTRRLHSAQDFRLRSRRDDTLAHFIAEASASGVAVWLRDRCEHLLAPCPELQERSALHLPDNIGTDESDVVRRNAERLADPDGRQVYAQRSSIAETVFSILRDAMKFNECHPRGMRKVNAEWKQVCMVRNLKRMHRLLWSSAPC